MNFCTDPVCEELKKLAKSLGYQVSACGHGTLESMNEMANLGIQKLMASKNEEDLKH